VQTALHRRRPFGSNVLAISGEHAVFVKRKIETWEGSEIPHWIKELWTESFNFLGKTVTPAPCKITPLLADNVRASLVTKQLQTLHTFKARRMASLFCAAPGLSRDQLEPCNVLFSY
jgi:hypothetical protein